jgi:hypothetical protein
MKNILFSGAMETVSQHATVDRGKHSLADYSTVTDFARFLGWSTSVPFSTATW